MEDTLGCVESVSVASITTSSLTVFTLEFAAGAVAEAEDRGAPSNVATPSLTLSTLSLPLLLELRLGRPA